MNSVAEPLVQIESSTKRELQRCMKSPYYFLTKYCITLDGDAPANEKFSLFPKYPHIKEICDSYIENVPLLILKSRQQIVSWTLCGLFVWSCRFEIAFQGFIVSRKEDEVDDKTIGSLMGRIRFIWDKLPPFLLDGYGYQTSKLRISCPATFSQITGESANPNSGRGRTFSKALMDEAAFIPDNEDVFSSLSMACKRGMIVVSTLNYRERGGPKAPMGVVKRLRKEQEDKSGFKRIVIHWLMNPRCIKGLYTGKDGKKRSPWYDQMCELLVLDWRIAAELDLKLEDSVAGAIYPMFTETSHITKEAAFDPERVKLMTWWDFGLHDLTVILWAQQDYHKRLFIFDEYMSSGPEYDHYRDIYYKMRQDIEVKAQIILKNKNLDFDRGWKCYNIGDPHTASARESDGLNWVRRLERSRPSIPFQRTPRHRNKEKLYAVVRKALLKGKLFIHPRCEQTIEAFQCYRFHTNPEGDVMSLDPVHDRHSHPMDAVQYGVAWCHGTGEPRRGIIGCQH